MLAALLLLHGAAALHAPLLPTRAVLARARTATMAKAEKLNGNAELKRRMGVALFQSSFGRSVEYRGLAKLCGSSARGASSRFFQLL